MQLNNLGLKCFFIISVHFFSVNLYSQVRKDSANARHLVVIPVAYTTPEIGVAGGISGSYTFKTTHAKDSTIRTSIIQGIGFVTSRHQNVQALDAAIYLPKENYIVLCQLAHTYFPDKFWGIGSATSDQPYERYLYEQAYAGTHIKKKIYKSLFVGALYEFQSVYRIRYKNTGIFDTSSFAGKDPYKVSGVGLSLSYDTRNSAFWPSRGLYFLTQLTGFDRRLKSDYDLLKWITDVRYFKKIAQGQIMAFQLLNYETYGSVPLRELAGFGGPNNMRGFYQGRFRAKNMVSLISEYRLHLKGRFSTVLFGGLGNVYNCDGDLTTKGLKYSYGAGLRFAILEKEKLNVRVDYGYSNKFNQGLYITFGECF
jgi:hypothetical protein